MPLAWRQVRFKRPFRRAGRRPRDGRAKRWKRVSKPSANGSGSGFPLRILALPQRRSDLPPRARLTLRGEQAVDLVRARLMPPPTASLPGGYDFAQRAWFDGIGAVGTILGDVSRVPGTGAASPPLRARLSAHIHGESRGRRAASRRRW